MKSSKIDFSLHNENSIFKIYSSDEPNCNGESLYDNNIELFNELDYQLQRYKVKYCVAIIKLNIAIKASDIDFKSMIRLTDKHLTICDCYTCIIFTHVGENKAYLTAMALERKLAYMTSVDIPFKCALVEKCTLSPTKSCVLKVCKMIELKTDEYIII